MMNEYERDLEFTQNADEYNRSKRESFKKTDKRKVNGKKKKFFLRQYLIIGTCFAVVAYGSISVNSNANEIQEMSEAIEDEIIEIAETTNVIEKQDYIQPEKQERKDIVATQEIMDLLAKTQEFVNERDYTGLNNLYRERDLQKRFLEVVSQSNGYYQYIYYDGIKPSWYFDEDFSGLLIRVCDDYRGRSWGLNESADFDTLNLRISQVKFENNKLNGEIKTYILLPVTDEEVDYCNNRDDDINKNWARCYSEDTYFVSMTMKDNEIISPLYAECFNEYSNYFEHSWNDIQRASCNIFLSSDNHIEAVENFEYETFYEYTYSPLIMDTTVLLGTEDGGANGIVFNLAYLDDCYGSLY